MTVAHPIVSEGPDRPLGRWLAAEAELVAVSGKEPFLLDDPDAVWVVEEGKVEIFTVGVEDGRPVGARSHFVSVEPGGSFFGMELDLYGMGSGFLAVGRMGTRLYRTSRQRLRELARDPAYRAEIAGLADAWVFAMSRSLTRDIVPRPRVDVGLKPGETLELSGEQRARAARRVVWLEVGSGALLFIGMEDLPADAAGWSFPLAPDSWIEAANDHGVATDLEARSAAEALADGALWRGLERFHEAVCQCEFLNKKLAGVDELNRLRAKADYTRSVRQAAYHDLLGVLEDVAPALPAAAAGDRGEAFFRASVLVGEASGLEVRRHPDLEAQRSHAEVLAATAKASGFRTRQVALRGDWWREDQGPILAELEETGRPVALLPDGPRGYVAVDPEAGTRTPVDDELAEELASFATVFYRPFPAGALGAFDLVRFGARGLAGDVWMLVAMGVGIGLLGTLAPYFTGRIFDSAIPQAERGVLVQFAAALLLAAVVISSFKLVQAIAVIRIQGKMDYSIQAGLWDRLLDLPATFFRAYSAGDLADRVGGINRIRALLSGAGISAILGAFSSIFFVALMLFYSLTLSVVAIGLTLVFVGFSTTVNYLQLRHQRRQLEIRGRITGLVLELISGVSKLRVAGAEDHAFRVWTRQFSTQRRIDYKVGKIANSLVVFGSGFPVLSSLAIFAALVSIQSRGGSSLTTGQFIAFSAAYIAFLVAVQSLADASINLLQVVPIYERLRPILVTTPEVDEAKSYPGKLSGRIEVSHLHFRYTPDGPWVIRDVSLVIEPGEMVAFVGGSGSGKSTLLRLLLGFETPEKGSVYYDGQDLGSLDLREVRQQMGVVLQDSKLLPTNIFTNIVCASASLTLDDAWEAAEQAGLAADINAMPMGMHTHVSAGGGGFSGGQKQRLLIARALANRPRILFFDEATSALDNRAQAVVTESMERLQATRVVIAHRLSTIKGADRICVLDRGIIREQGTYEELMAADGLFAELARRQIS